MIAKLYLYFGLTGIASALAWVLAAGCLAWAWPRRRRPAGLFAALGVGAAALALAAVNSARVSAIRLDRTDELAAAQEQLRRIREAEAAESEAGVIVPRFAEDAPGERSDLAGFTRDQLAAATGALSVAGEPEYRRQGKQQRESGKSGPLVAGGADVAPEPPKERTLKQADLLKALRLDRLNRLGARFAVLLALGLIAWDYLQRFNAIREPYYPLPIGGRWLNDLWPRSGSAEAKAASAAELAGLLRHLVRKGETFVCFGPQDPLPAEAVLFRLQVRRWRLWRLPKLAWGEAGLPTDCEFLFDALWFRRYCVVHAVPAAAVRDLEGLAAWLELARRTRASALHGVNIVWWLPPPPPELRARLQAVCADANFRFVQAL